MANKIKPESLKVKIRSLSCRDDEYEFVKSLDPSGRKSFKAGFCVLLEMTGYSPNLKKIAKKG